MKDVLKMSLAPLVASAQIACHGGWKKIDCPDDGSRGFIEAIAEAAKRVVSATDENGVSRLDTEMAAIWPYEMKTDASELADVYDNLDSVECATVNTDPCDAQIDENGYCAETAMRATLSQNEVWVNVSSDIFAEHLNEFNATHHWAVDYNLDELIELCDYDTTDGYREYMSSMRPFTGAFVHELSHFELGRHKVDWATKTADYGNLEDSDQCDYWGYAGFNVTTDMDHETMCQFPNYVCREDGTYTVIYYDDVDDLEHLLESYGETLDVECDQ